MSIPSNLYAEKIFAEHPSALWSLDDQADYVSLISEQNRNLSNWEISSDVFESWSQSTDAPFPDSYVGKITGEIPTGDSGQIVCISPNLVNFSELDQKLGTFSIGAYLNSSSIYVSSVDIGYQYNDINSGLPVQSLKHYESSISGKWFFVSETFAIPPQDVQVKIVIKINYIGGSLNAEDYEFFINGVTLGQWSEEFNATSLGITPVSMPETIYGHYVGRRGIEAKAYGIQDKTGYYVVSNNFMHAKNTGIPIVYGATSLTNLSPASQHPSLIFPGLGFLNEDGKYNDYTLEAWLRINSDSTTIKKIIGPVASEDGLYVEGPFIKLRIGSNFGSYYIGEWYRPMLVHIRVTDNAASVLINGEQVISISFSTLELDLPLKTYNGKDQDWVGVYAHTEVTPVEVDCVAIYPYVVPLVVAKRRFVYGQGVEFPEGINQAYSGSSIYIDYPFADYTNNYAYPDTGNWSQAIVDNLSVTNKILSTPDYQLPDVVLDNFTTEELYLDNKTANQNSGETNTFFTFRPNVKWSNPISPVNGFMFFKNLNFLTEKIRSFYGVFGGYSLSSSVKTLFHLEAENTNNYFSIVLQGNQINHILSYNGVTETVHTLYGIKTTEKLSVALDLDKFAEHFGGSVAAFLGNSSSLKLYVGGQKDFTKTFSGKIYSIGFCNSRNHLEVQDDFGEVGTSRQYENVFDIYGNLLVGQDSGNAYFGEEGYAYDASGILVQVDSDLTPGFYNNWDQYPDPGPISLSYETKFIDHIASYTLLPRVQFGDYYFDIDVSSYWEDYVPLQYFAQYVEDEKGDQYYDLDFIQFNINYPSPSVFLEEQQSSTWKYEDLQDEYSNPVQRTYSSLDNYLYTGYLDYNDLKNRVSKSYKYDTTESLVRSFITFQYIKTGANAVDGYFTKTELPPKESVIEPGADWLNTKYEVVNNMLIYPPNANISSLAIVTHLVFKVKGILKNKVTIKNLEYASQAFNSASPNAVGTRFGNNIYPYKLSGLYYDYKSNNPFTIYKGSSPYLYLTRYSGIELKGKYDPLVTRGLSIPINSSASDKFNVLAMQSAVRFDQDFFPFAPTEIFEIKSSDVHTKFFLVANHPSGKRAKIYGVNAITGELENNIGFYWNGKIVKEPVITIKEWGFLGIAFPKLLNFANVVGAININGPLMFNAISYYQSTNLQDVQITDYRPWFNVKYIQSEEIEWDYWKTASYLWDGILVRGKTSYYGVDPSTIYKSYTGTNKIVIDTDNEIRLQGYDYSIYSDIKWKSNTVIAV